MPRIPLLLALLVAGCAGHDDGVPPSPPGSLSPDAEKDFILPASSEISSVEPSKDYPIDFCVVSREDLMTDGQPVAVMCNGVEVQFCCDHCVAKFKANPEKYLAILNEAKAAKAGK
jgi:hypothetical protein